MLISARKYALECNWNCCPRYSDITKFNIEKASNGDRVFVNLDFIQNFLSEVRKSNKKFIIICQNSDKEFNNYWFTLLKDYAIHIYTINCVIQNDIVTSIPIGFVDWKVPFLTILDCREKERTIEINASFTLETNRKIREPCKDALLNDSRVSFFKIEPLKYYDSLLNSKYVVCPEGEGHDTHRLYESIYCGAIPILLRPSCLEYLYKNYPIKWVDSWDNISLDWEKDKKILNNWILQNPQWYSTSFHKE